MAEDFAQDDALVQDFLIESEELLQRMDQDMVTLEAAPSDADLLNRIFRALHTIKGTSGFLGYEPVVRLSHRAEDVLNRLRKGEIHLTRRMMDALLAARDYLGQMLADIRQGGLKKYEIDHLVAELEAVQQPEAPPPLGDLLVAEQVVTPAAVEDALRLQASLPEHKKFGQILVEKGMASPVEIGDALVRQKELAPAAAAAPESATMRVDVRKLDELINLVGELVLERNRLVQLSRDFSNGKIDGESLDSAFSLSTARLSFLTEELQGAGLRTRMVPIDAVFRKFPRLVRDVARTVEKEVELVVKGEDTEIDKTMVELIGDPLIHIVRNSLDHGLEKPEARLAAGKPASGSIRLEAEQEGDQIVISVADDGAGIDPDRIARKAIEKGLTTADRVRGLSTREILDFIFLPGFSTAEKVNDLSGRGVGMDVVRSNLKKMNGTVDIDSHVGKGTTIRLRLPLTLAILPVLLVEVVNEIYALPLRSVVETAHVEAREIHRVEGNEVLRLRGETLPLVRLGNMFKSSCQAGSCPNDKVVVLGIGERKVAILVDQLVGQESTVIKPLGTYLHNCSSLAGATISGDGRVRLVLDPAGLLMNAQNMTAQEQAS
ncbi:MAG TPA: chemotaxis protein CheA [Terriglobales bacterium]|jgi:two-component system chemotaxis sensor kinase CheA